MRKIIFLLLFCVIGFLSFCQESNMSLVQTASNYFIWLKPQMLSDSTIKLNVVYPVGYVNLLNETKADFPKDFINFNPALRFEKDRANLEADSTTMEALSKYYYIVLDSVQSFGDITLMVAYQSNEMDKFGIWSIADTSEKLFLSSRSVTMGGMNLDYCMDNYLFPVVNSLYQNIGLVNNVRSVTDTNITDTNTSIIDTLFIGKGNDLNYVGNLAEVMIFYRQLSEVERNKWESYLYMKYGVTIIGDHYFNSLNDTLWNTTTDSLYSFGVAAIGFDTATTLAQEQSQIFEDNVVVALGNSGETNNILNTNSLPDNSFIFWGHNDSENEFWGEEYVIDTATYMLLDRKWKLKTHNLTTNPQTTLVYNYNTDYLAERIIMLIDRTNEFVFTSDTTGEGYYTNNELGISTSQMLYPDTIIDGSLYFRNINWVNNQSSNDVIFTFAYVQYPSDVIITTKSSMDENNHNSNGEDYFSLLPNPSRGTYTLHIELQEQSAIEVSIVDAIGKIVSKTNYPSDKVFDISGNIKEMGSYFVNINYGNHQKKSLKLIISY
jgi:hypothetical protein